MKGKKIISDRYELINSYLSLIIFVGFHLVLAPSLFALPVYRSMVSQKKGMTVNCTLCHDKESWELNGFGKDFLKQGHNFKAIDLLDSIDSDKDGVVSSEEWKTKSNPGDPASRPGREGLWLNEAKPTRAPKKVLAPLFPKDVTYQIQEGHLAEEILKSVENVLGRNLVDEETFPTLFWILQGGRPLGVATYSIFGSNHHGLSVVLTIVQGNKILKIHPVHLHSKKLGKDLFLKQFEGKGVSQLGTIKPPPGLEMEVQNLIDSIKASLLILERCSL